MVGPEPSGLSAAESTALGVGIDVAGFIASTQNPAFPCGLLDIALGFEFDRYASCSGLVGLAVDVAAIGITIGLEYALSS